MTMKRLAAPRFWPIEKKTYKFVVTPRPGPHPKRVSIPLVILIRDILGYARTVKEVRTILNKGLVKVDSKIKKDYAYPVGLMDVITIGDEYYMIVPFYKGFDTVGLKKDESTTKLCRIRNKTCVRGKIQLNLHDGKNILLEKDEAKQYKTGDVLVFDTEKKAVKQHIKFEKGATALIISGHRRGAVGKIEDIIITKSSQPNQVVIEIEDRKIPIPKDYIFVIGKDKPVISLGEKK